MPEFLDIYRTKQIFTLRLFAILCLFALKINCFILLRFVFRVSVVQFNVTCGCGYAALGYSGLGTTLTCRPARNMYCGSS